MILVAVSKYASVDQVRELAAAGHRRFGENRIQEAVSKIRALKDQLDTRLEWHMIGHLQTNKVSQAVDHFAMIQTVDSPRLAEAISRRAVYLDLTIPVLIQVNVSADPAKHGLSREDAVRNYPEICNLAGLDVVGLMTIGPEPASPEGSRPVFAALGEVRRRLDQLQLAPPLRHLSMGMSADFEVAVEEGATIVRVGAALFGDARR